MSDILIKGMEMPKSCCACLLKMNCDACEGWECFCLPLRTKIGYYGDLLADKRRDDCPLVPVPAHGRCIDADALKQNTYEIYDPMGIIEAVPVDVIDNAPTVTEAEEGET